MTRMEVVVILSRNTVDHKMIDTILTNGYLFPIYETGNSLAFTICCGAIGVITLEDMRGLRTLKTRLDDESLLDIIEEIVFEAIVDKPYSKSESSDAITFIYVGVFRCSTIVQKPDSHH
ncbi:hypothetical protein EDD85DRAFT_798048 [Armillaria nabsnona]|nr:hypothetical protein EDD85DRAFT_798048 [Armillaria nabsnona]